MKIPRFARIAALLALAAVASPDAPGAQLIIYRPTEVQLTQGTSPAGDSYKPVYTVDNTGLQSSLDSGALLDTALTVSHTVAVSSQGSGVQNWLTSASTTADYFDAASTTLAPILVYNLGARIDNLQGIVFWALGIGQGTAINEASAKTLEVRFSLDGVDFSQTPALTFNLAPPPTATVAAPSLAPAQKLAFGNAYSAQYIQIKITDNFYGSGGAANTGNRVGFGELRLYGDAIPEPGTGALLFGAASLLLVARRFNRRGGKR